MKKGLLISILVLVSSVMGYWEEPITLNGATPNYTHGLFFDSISGATYVFYARTTYESSKVLSYLCYKKISHETQLLKEDCVLQDRNIEDVDAIGKGDNLYVVFNARRKKNEVTCTSSNTEGCYDVYFTESKDGGDTWSKPVQIPRKRDNTFHRRHPNILFVEGSNRLFVSYILDMNSAIIFKYSTRPESSSIFNNEQDIAREYPDNYGDFKILSRKISNGAEIVFFYKNKENFYYMYSQNNGVTWKKIEKQIIGKSGRYSIAVSNDKKDIYIATEEEYSATIAWLNEKHEWMEKGYNLFDENNNFAPFVSWVPDDNNKIVFSGHLNQEDVNICTYDKVTKRTICYVDDTPEKALDKAVTFIYNGAKKIRVITSIDMFVFLETYNYSQQQKLIIFKKQYWYIQFHTITWGFYTFFVLQISSHILLREISQKQTKIKFFVF